MRDVVKKGKFRTYSIEFDTHTVAVSLLRSSGAVLVSAGSQSVFIALMAPDIVCMASFSWTSTRLQCVYFSKQDSSVQVFGNIISVLFHAAH